MIAVGEVNEGLAPIFVSKNEKIIPNLPQRGETLVGYINEGGKIVIEPRFDWGFSFCQGLAYVERGKFKGYINRSGQVVFDLERHCSPRSAQARERSIALCGPQTLKEYPFAEFSKGLAHS